MFPQLRVCRLTNDKLLHEPDMTRYQQFFREQTSVKFESKHKFCLWRLHCIKVKYYSRSLIYCSLKVLPWLPKCGGYFVLKWKSYAAVLKFCTVACGSTFLRIVGRCLGPCDYSLLRTKLKFKLKKIKKCFACIVVCEMCSLSPLNAINAIVDIDIILDNPSLLPAVNDRPASPGYWKHNDSTAFIFSEKTSGYADLQTNI